MIHYNNSFSMKLYKADIDVIVADTYKEITRLKKYKTLFAEDLKTRCPEEYEGTVFYSWDNTQAKFLMVLMKDSLSVESITHEAWHLTHRLYQYLGMSPDESNKELYADAQAKLVGMLVEDLL